MSVKSRCDLRENWVEELKNLRSASQRESTMVEEGRSAADPSEVEQLSTLLKTAMPFADSDSGDVFVWDLASYLESDDSYDIYAIFELYECSPRVCRIGRSFSDFVQEFLLGEESLQMKSLPESFREWMAYSHAIRLKFFRLD